MDRMDMATSSCDGLVASRRGLRRGARVLPQCGTPKKPVEPCLMSKILRHGQAVSVSLSLSLSGTAAGVNA